MNLNLTQLFDSIIVSGDIHGDIMPLVSKIQQYKIQNSLIIVAGDSGIGFHKDGYYINLFKKAETRLKKSGNILFLMRGNHDDPDKWGQYEPFKKHWQDGTSSVRLLNDYTTISVSTDRKSHNILCVGGAISIDRIHRVHGKTYWPGEPFVYDETKLDGLTNITDVITHSCPNFCGPILKGGVERYADLDVSIKKDCDKERTDHTLLYNKLKENGNSLRMWMYGHFHFTNKEYVGETLFRMCDIMELVEL